MEKLLPQGRCPQKNMQGFSLLEVLIVIVILGVVLGFVAQLVQSVQRDYLVQMQLIEAQNNARTALDTVVRLVRIAGNDPERIGVQPIDPDPDGNGQFDSVHLQADWNPPDGALDDPYEDIIFSTNNGSLIIQEPSSPFNPAAIPFLDRIQAVTFAYFDRNNNPVADPVATPGSIASIDIVVQTDAPGPGGAPLTFRSSATIRRRE